MHSGQTKYGVGMTVSACLWLGLFPLLQFGSFQTLTVDKWTWMLILTGVSLGCFLVDLFSRRVSRPRLLPLLLGAALLLWTVLSCLMSPYPGNPWWIGAGRREGLVSQLCYLGLFFPFSFSRVRRAPVLISAGVGLSVFMIIVFLQRAGGNPLGLYPEGYSYANAPYFLGTVGNIDLCAGYLLILCGLFVPELFRTAGELLSAFFTRGMPASSASDLPERSINSYPEFSPSAVPDAQVLALRSKQCKHARFILILECLFLLAAIGVSIWLFIITKVRFGLVVLAVLIACSLIRLLPKKARLPVLLLLLVLVLAFGWFFPGQQNSSVLREFHEILHGRPQFAFGAGRIGVWTYTLKMLETGDRLLFGSGADTFALRFSAFLKTFYEEHPDAEHLTKYYDTPHSEYLALCVNCGLPALLFFLSLVIGGCLTASPWRDSVLSYALQAAFSFSVCIVAPIFWVILGLAWTSPPDSAADH